MENKLYKNEKTVSKSSLSMLLCKIFAIINGSTLNQTTLRVQIISIIIKDKNLGLLDTLIISRNPFK